MSYEIIKRIKLEDSKVLITSTANNVRPRHYEEWESNFLTDILQKQGKEEAELAILEAYESGNFQGGNNKYKRALFILRHYPEFKKFSWRDNWDNYKENREKYPEEYKALLKKTLNSKLPKTKFIITKITTPLTSSEQIQVFGKLTAYRIKWYREAELASVFNYKEDAEDIIKNFTGSDNWQVKQIN